jgi:hypothetical protein
MRTLRWRWPSEEVEDSLSDGGHAGLWRRFSVAFFSARSFETTGLKKGVSDHRHQGVSMQADPGSAFEMIEAKFFLELLMRLFADPSGLDCRGKLFEAHICRQI